MWCGLVIGLPYDQYPQHTNANQFGIPHDTCGTRLNASAIKLSSIGADVGGGRTLFSAGSLVGDAIDVGRLAASFRQNYYEQGATYINESLYRQIWNPNGFNSKAESFYKHQGRK